MLQKREYNPVRKALLLFPCDMEETQIADQGLQPLPSRAHTQNLASPRLGAHTPHLGLQEKTWQTEITVMTVRKHYDGKGLGDDLAQQFSTELHIRIVEELLKNTDTQAPPRQESLGLVRF